MKRFWPQSLIGEILLIVALMLLLAQAINSILLYRGGQAQNLVEASTAAVARIAYGLERQDRMRRAPPSEKHRGPRGGRLYFSPESPVAERASRKSELENRAGQALTGSGVEFNEVRAATYDELPLALTGHVIGHYRRALHGHEINRTMGSRRGETKDNGYIVISVKLQDNQWVSIASSVRDHSSMLVKTVLLQTVVIYLLLLIPLILLGRYISRPLKSLTLKTRNFQPGQDNLLVEQGPGDIKELVRAFNDMSGRVSAMLAEKDVMLGAIGHDLRTPLAALRVRVESVDDDSERERMVAVIEDMDQTLDDILSLARIGKGKEQVQATDIGSLIETVTDEFIDIGRPVSFNASARHVVAIRATLIRRALRNLIDNGIKYGQSVIVSVEKIGDNLSIHIDDQGPGIVEDQIPLMFEPFARAEQSRNRATGGSGLGLTLARTIARDHGGDVILTNRPQGGLRASLILPLNGDQ